MQRRLFSDRLLQIGDLAGEQSGLIAEVQPQISSDLVVAAAPGAQLAA